MEAGQSLLAWVVEHLGRLTFLAPSPCGRYRVVLLPWKRGEPEGVAATKVAALARLRSLLKKCCPTGTRVPD